MIAAAIRTLVTSYTRPGDRVLLADLPAPESDTSAPSRLSTPDDQRDGFVEAVLRLGRGVTTAQPANPGPTHPTSVSTRGSGATNHTGAESGSGPGSADPDATVPIRAAVIAKLDHRAPQSARFTLIITIGAATESNPVTISHHAGLLTEVGTLAVLTHGHIRGGDATARTCSRTRLAALAGLTLTDRLVLLHQPPSLAPPLGRDRLRVVLGGHRRIHTDAWIYRLITAAEVSDD